MRNMLRKLAAQEITDGDNLAFFEKEHAQEELFKTDREYEKYIEKFAGRVPELEGKLMELNNDVRTNALFGGYEAGMRMGAQLIYELLIKEGGIA